jgi:acyl-CoA thioesterase YciA|tara:strand:+ start:252 stop:647 length:396 start_codon:yes stop_codon:yes gene_type:complete
MKLITTHPIKKSDLGLHNNLFGGKLLAWIDAAGAAFTTEYVDSPRLVTVMIDKCIFKKPAKEGQLLKIYGQIKEVGTSSITAYLEARAHNVYDGNQKLILSTSIKFVRIDEGGDPIPIHQRIRDKFESGNK